MSMRDWLSSTARSIPDEVPALIIGKRTWTYFELMSLVDELCGRLDSVGVKRGDKVAALLPNGVDYVCLIHALAKIGGVLVPLNTRLTPDELQWQIEQAGCKFLICAAELPVISVQMIMLDELTRIAPTDFSPVSIDLDAVQSIVFTSGTTGKPKGAQITFGNIDSGAMASFARLGNHVDRWLCPLPFYHVGGMSIVFRCCMNGSAVVLPEQSGIEALMKSLHDSQATMVSLVPTQLYRLLEAGFEPPKSLRLILLGGAAATPELVARCIEKNLPIALTYGLTECASQVATATPDQVRAKPGTVGKPLSGSMVRVVDADGHNLPPNRYGEVVVDGSTVMKGYLGQPSTNGTFHTGDIGYLDTDGDLWIVQRRSDLIISGGENVYPSEVEAVLRQHPAVEDACVVGLPDAEWGQRVVAMVALRKGTSLTEAELITFSRERLAGYKQPRKIVFVDELPQTASGKVQRGKVREQMTNA